jgi:putative phosphoesterase
MSDTHGFLDKAVFQHFAECDEIWHAGDFGTTDVLQELQAFKPVRGVYGNVDGADLRLELPLEAAWEVGGMNVYMTHIGGRPGHYERGVKERLIQKSPDLFICGHSHILAVMRDPALGLLYMNPGASGHVGWHRVRTLLRFTIEDGKPSDCHAIELGPRGTVKPRSSRRE